MYQDPKVAGFVDQHFTPVRVHVREDAGEFKRLGAQFNALWTPTVLVVDASGQERHRIEGFLPADEFLPQLMLALGHSAFAQSRFDEAETRFREIVAQYEKSDAAPEALYWAGVSRYKMTGDAAALGDAARRFKERYQETSWAKKASVWG